MSLAPMSESATGPELRQRGDRPAPSAATRRAQGKQLGLSGAGTPWEERGSCSPSDPAAQKAAQKARSLGGLADGRARVCSVPHCPAAAPTRCPLSRATAPAQSCPDPQAAHSSSISQEACSGLQCPAHSLGFVTSTAFVPNLLI